MREIKFRAWDKEEEKMLYNDDVSIIYNEIMFDDISKKDYEDLRGMKLWVKETPISASIHEAVFMQYTGLKDKNNKEVYEGDIVKVRIAGDYFNCIVKYDFDRYKLFKICMIKSTPFSFERIEEYYHKKTYKVIGNIYENPELIKNLDNLEIK